MFAKYYSKIGTVKIKICSSIKQVNKIHFSEKDSLACDRKPKKSLHWKSKSQHWYITTVWIYLSTSPYIKIVCIHDCAISERLQKLGDYIDMKTLSWNGKNWYAHTLFRFQNLENHCILLDRNSCNADPSTDVAINTISCFVLSLTRQLLSLGRNDIKQ